MKLSNDAKKLREARKHLRDLHTSVGGFLLYMDSVMRGPSTTERGKAIATGLNSLDMANQIAYRYGLDNGKRKKATHA